VVFDNVFIKIIREDIPTILGLDGQQHPIDFKSGQKCQLINLDTESPGYGETFNMVIGENNQLTAIVLMLNIQSIRA